MNDPKELDPQAEAHAEATELQRRLTREYEEVLAKMREPLGRLIFFSEADDKRKNCDSHDENEIPNPPHHLFFPL